MPLGGNHLVGKMIHLEGVPSTDRIGVTTKVINQRHMDSTDENRTSVLETSGKEIA